MNYNNFTYKELLNDDFFIESVLNPTQESERFWNKLGSREQSLAEEIILARKIIVLFSYRRHKMTPAAENELLERIITTIKKKKNAKNQNFLNPTTFSIVACALLLIVSGYFMFSFFPENRQSTIEMVEKPTLHVSEIQLIKSDEKVTIEGESPVIQYDNRGKLSIHSDEQPEKIVTSEKTANRSYHQLIVPYAKRSFLTLSDGTQIWMNANTRLVYPIIFTENKREIFVDGEIYLEVSTDKNRPFIVKTKNMDIHVLGTSFNVSSYENDDYTSVVLVTGKVNVYTKDNQSAVMSPNEMTFLKYGRLETQKVNVKNYISWRMGTYTFDNENFSVVLKKLSHYYGKELVLDQKSDDFYCSGTLSLRDELSQLLKGLEKAYPISFTQNENLIIVNVESIK